MKTVLKLNNLFLSVFPVFLLFSCSLTGNNSLAGSEAPYSSKNTCIYQYIDEENSVLELVSEFEYTGDGEIIAKCEYEYEIQSDGTYLNTVNYIYIYTDGMPELFSKTEFEYFKDYYDGVNYDYICYREMDYIYRNGSYSLSETAETEYDGQSAGVDGNPNQYANYTTYTIYDASGVIEHAQTCTWIMLPDGYYGYQVERYYNGEISSGNLLEEYVCHYDTDTNYTRYQYEMCHFAYNNEDIYYYTTYPRDVEHRVYQQSDYVYSVEASVDVDANGQFADTDTGDGENDLDQIIKLENIGSQQYVLNYEFNTSGSRTKKNGILDGKLVSYTVYSYDNFNNLIKTSEYEDGGAYLYSYETIDYSEKYDNSGSYSYIETTLSYDFSSGYSDYVNNKESSRRISEFSVIDSFFKNKPSLLKQNHRI